MIVLLFIVVFLFYAFTGDQDGATNVLKWGGILFAGALVLLWITKLFPDDNKHETRRVRNRDVKNLPSYTNGHEYEYFVAAYLKRNGFTDVEITPKSGDFGADIICKDQNGQKVAVQCKLYNQPVGYKAIEEVIGGMHYYNCQRGIVVTNNTFTKQARDAAGRMGIMLYDYVSCRNDSSESETPYQKPKSIKYISPGGTYYKIYEHMAKQTHLLVGGALKSGIRVVINGFIYTQLLNTPDKSRFILIESKRAELKQYKNCPHIIEYASEPGDIIKVLEYSVRLMELRYQDVKNKERKYIDNNVYVVIDELADILAFNKHKVQSLLQRLLLEGKMANVHIVASTRCLTGSYIPVSIKKSFDSIVALHTSTAEESECLLDATGCELLPQCGQGYYHTPEGTKLYIIPMYTDQQINALVSYWNSSKCIVK